MNKERNYDLEYVGQGDAGLVFKFRCTCGEQIRVAERPWWKDDGLCNHCGRIWTLNLFAECEGKKENDE